MNIKKISMGLLFLILALVVVPGASAYSSYSADQDHPHPVSAIQAVACKACHVANNAPLNVQNCTKCHPDPYPPAPVLTTITISPATANLLIGGTQVFTASARDQNGKVMTPVLSWTSSNDTVGTIDASGNFNALAAGTTTIKAANGTVYGTASVTVTSSTPTPVLTTITVTPATANLLIGGTQKFTAVAKDQNGIVMTPVISWTSSNDTVGTIDASGNFSALAEGTTIIKAENGTVNGTASVTVTVTPSVQTPVLTTIKVVPPTAKIIVGKNRSFMAKTFDQFNNKISALVTWASSNTSVGTIDNNGKFTALSTGKTTITATNGTINGSATITVKAKSFEHVDDDSKENEEHKEDIEDAEDTEDTKDQQELDEELDED